MTQIDRICSAIEANASVCAEACGPFDGSSYRSSIITTFLVSICIAAVCCENKTLAQMTKYREAEKKHPDLIMCICLCIYILLIHFQIFYKNKHFYIINVFSVRNNYRLAILISNTDYIYFFLFIFLVPINLIKL